MLILLVSLAQPHKSFGDDINLSRHQWTSAQCHLLCYTPLVVSSFPWAPLHALCFVWLWLYCWCLQPHSCFSNSQRTLIKYSGTGGLSWKRGDAKAGPPGASLMSYGIIDQPIGQPQNSSLLPVLHLFKSYEFQDRDIFYLVQNPAGQDLQWHSANNDQMHQLNSVHYQQSCGWAEGGNRTCRRREATWIHPFLCPSWYGWSLSLQG